MAKVLRITMSREKASRLLRALPAILAGRGTDPAGLSRALALRLGLTALSYVKQAYVKRATGAADESGMKWAPHAESTKKRRGPKALIGRDDGILLNSLGPGAVSARAGLASIATNVPYAPYFHEDRPIWPPPEQWPARWLAGLQRQLLEGAQAIATALLQGAA